MYHISIYFDVKSENRIRGNIKRVAQVTGNHYMLEVGVPPHITLSAFECEKEEELLQRLEAMTVAMRSGTLHWVSVGTFLPGVIFLQPVLNEYLQGWAMQVHDCLKIMEGIKIRPCYQPFSWLPHTTIAKKLSAEELRQAFAVLQQEFGVFEGKVVRIGLAKMNPHRELVSWDLK